MPSTTSEPRGPLLPAKIGSDKRFNGPRNRLDLPELVTGQLTCPAPSWVELIPTGVHRSPVAVFRDDRRGLPEVCPRVPPRSMDFRAWTEDALYGRDRPRRPSCPPPGGKPQRRAGRRGAAAAGVTGRCVSRRSRRPRFVRGAFGAPRVARNRPRRSSKRQGRWWWPRWPTTPAARARKSRETAPRPAVCQKSRTAWGDRTVRFLRAERGGLGHAV